jgi:hypothetical protein
MPEENLVGTMTCFDKKIEVCRYQPTEGGPPRMILARPTSTVSGNYHVIPHNYSYSFHTMRPTPTLHAEVGGLTRSGRCYTPEELEDQRRAKGKNVVELAKIDEVNKPVSDEEAKEFLKLMKHSEYSVVDQLKKTPLQNLSIIISLEFRVAKKHSPEGP